MFLGNYKFFFSFRLLLVKVATNNCVDAILLITEHQIFETIISQAGLCKTKAPDYTTWEKEFRSEYGLKNNQDLSNFFKVLWTHYTQLKSKDKKKGNSYILGPAAKVPVSMERELQAEPTKKKTMEKSQ